MTLGDCNGQVCRPDWSLGTPPSQPLTGTPPSQPLTITPPSQPLTGTHHSQPLSQLSLPSQIHAQPDQSPALSLPRSSQPFSQASQSEPEPNWSPKKVASESQPCSSSGSRSQVSLPNQIHQSTAQSECWPNSQSSQPCDNGLLGPAESKPVLQQQQSSLSNQVEAEPSICSTISQQSISSSTSSQDGVREMSRISQEIAAEERIVDVKGWRED